ncbi:MAG: SUMF1/EgtB/PvdO family nonheme iron enzyme [Calditrichia bacterium]
MKPQTIAKATLFISLILGLFCCSQPLEEEDARLMLSEKGLFAKSYSWSGVAINDTSAGFANQFSLSFDSSLVYDAASGLTWQQAGSEIEMTFAETEAYIDSLNRVKSSGFDGWRLPTLEEAMILMEPQKKNWVHIDPMFNSHQRWIWTANEFDRQHVWRVCFGNGNCEPFDAERYQFVRAVRSGVGKKKNLTESIFNGMFALNQFAKIPAGRFLMGSIDDSADTDEQPVHLRISKEFYMGKYEVTQAQWREVMGTTVSEQRDKADKIWPLRGEGSNYPMYYISWNEVQDFIGKLNKAAGRNLYRLPTEVEWEYACRAGSISPFNTGANLTTDQANYTGNFPYRDFAKGEDREKTIPVGSFSPNAWGLYDMHGNVWEWCSDWYGAGYYQQFADKQAVDPQGPSNGSSRIVRGGSWRNSAQDCRSANRNRGNPDDRNNGVGFRLVFVP